MGILYTGLQQPRPATISRLIGILSSAPLTAGVVWAPQMIHNQFPPFFSVLHCLLGPGELLACPFLDESSSDVLSKRSVEKNSGQVLSLKLSRLVHNLFTCSVSMHGHCRVWSWLIEFSDDVLRYHTLSSLDYFQGRFTHKTGKVSHTIVQGNFLFNVIGQENYENTRKKKGIRCMTQRIRNQMHV